MVKLLATVLVGFSLMGEAMAKTYTLNSSDFKDQGEIPVDYTCEGGDKFPPLSWRGLFWFFRESIAGATTSARVLQKNILFLQAQYIAQCSIIRAFC